MSELQDKIDKVLANQELILTMLKSVNIKLNADAIVSTLRVENKEEVIMDLTEVTIMVITDKAILAVKKGYQKWIPKSLIGSIAVGDGEEYIEIELINEGDFLSNILLRDKNEAEKNSPEDWFPKKSWEKYEVKKR